MSCPLCGSSATYLRFQGGQATAPAAAAFGSSRSGAGEVGVRVCRACGAGWQDPMPSAESLAAAYRALRDPLYLAEEGGRRRSLRRTLHRLEDRRSGRRGRLLDVGCSAGLFLEIAEEAGWEVSGVEPSDWLASRARERFGERIFHGSFEEARFAAASFDAVCLWDVLEHVSDPAAFLAKAASLLRPHGVLGLNVPAIDSAIARLLGRRWPLLLPEHLFYFSRRSLRLLLAAQGLQDVRFHLHPVRFSAGYIGHRLAQHGLPGAKALAGLLRARRLASRQLPLLMGELTAFASRGEARFEPSPSRAGTMDS